MKLFATSGSLIALTGLFWGLLSSQNTSAQITPSGLGTTANGDGAGITCTAATCDLAGGSVNGNNWFLQFSEFSVSGGVTTADFNTPGGVTNIISLVNGPQPLIDGLLSVSGASPTADLFLINPSGIVFGPNAQLNVQGSFIASTASSITFDNGDTVPVDVASTALLTVAVPAGLQLPAPVNAIEVQASTNVLSVPANETLALVGGGISVNDRLLVAGGGTGGGRIELGSVGPNSLVSLSAVAGGYELGYVNVANRANITFTNAAQAIADAGNVRAFGNNISLTQGSRFSGNPIGGTAAGQILVDATGTLTLGGLLTGLFTQNQGGSGASGDITANVGAVVITDGAQIINSTAGSGMGGTTTINADSVLIEGSNLGFRSGIYSEALAGATAPAGQIIINADDLVMRDQAQITASTNSAAATGGGLALAIQNNILLRFNADITTNALAVGANAGDIDLTVGGFILAILSEDSDVVAAATSGGIGGDIEATASGIYGFNQFQGVLTSESDFTAISSGPGGVDGTLTLNIQEPPENELEDPELFENAIAEACSGTAAAALEEESQSSFVEVGAAGLAPQTSGFSHGDGLIVPLGEPITAPTTSPNSAEPTTPTLTNQSQHLPLASSCRHNLQTQQ